MEATLKVVLGYSFFSAFVKDLEAHLSRTYNINRSNTAPKGAKMVWGD